MFVQKQIWNFSKPSDLATPEFCILKKYKKYEIRRQALLYHNLIGLITGHLLTHTVMGVEVLPSHFVHKHKHSI